MEFKAPLIVINDSEDAKDTLLIRGNSRRSVPHHIPRFPQKCVGKYIYYLEYPDQEIWCYFRRRSHPADKRKSVIQ